MSESTPSSRHRFVIETILFLTYAMFGVSWIAVTPLINDIQAEFQISSTEFGLINTVVTVAKIFAPLLTGLVAVRIGIKRTILFGSLLISSAALAPLVPDFNYFLVARFIFGIGGAVVLTLLNPVVMAWFPKHELPMVNAFNNVAVNSGITVTLFTTVPLAAWIGWHQTLVLYGSISVVLVVAWAVWGREGPPSGVSRSGGAGKPTSEGARYRDVWKMKETWLITICFAAPLALYLAFNTWLPKYYMESFGMTNAAASRYTGFFNLIGIPAAIIGGYLTGRLGLRRPFIIAAGLFIGVASVGMYAWNNTGLILASAVVLGVGLFIAVSPLFTTAMELPGMTPSKVSLLMGTVFSGGYVLSSLSPTIVGYLKDQTGSFVPGFLVWTVFSLVVAVCGFLLPETGAGAGSSRRSAASQEG